MRSRRRTVVLTALAVVGALGTLALALAVGTTVPTRPLLALLAAAAVLVLGATLAQPAVIPLASMALILVIARVDLGRTDISVSDMALFAAFWPALLFGRRPYAPALRRILWLGAGYQAATLFTVVANPYLANAVEWVHAWLLISGALVVGWMVGRHGYARLGLSLLLLGTTVIALSAIALGVVRWSQGDFGPIYPTWPFPMHKNYAGCMLAIGALLAYSRPTWVGWSRRTALTAFWLCCLALAFTQSKQAIIGLAVSLVVLVLWSDPTVRRSRLVIIGAVPATVFVATVLRDQVASRNEFNSVFQRVTWFGDALSIWSHDPIFGVGLRWWYTSRFDTAFQPPNAEVEVVTSAGLVGLVGFVVLMVGTWQCLRRLPTAYAVPATVVILFRIVQSQFDLYWVGGQASVPFLVCGVAVGAMAHAQDRAATVQAVAAAEHRAAPLARTTATDAPTDASTPSTR